MHEKERNTYIVPNSHPTMIPQLESVPCQYSMAVGREVAKVESSKFRAFCLFIWHKSRQDDIGNETGILKRSLPSSMVLT